MDADKRLVTRYQIVGGLGETNGWDLHFAIGTIDCSVLSVPPRLMHFTFC
jgi:hypothetical protein